MPKPKKLDDLVDQQTKRLLISVAQQTAAHIAFMYPEVAKVDGKRVQQAAAAAANDIRTLEAMQIAFTPLGRENNKQWGLSITRKGVISNEPQTVVSFGAPIDLAECEDVNQIVTSATIAALLTSDLARALLYFHGYRLHFSLVPRDIDVTPAEKVN